MITRGQLLDAYLEARRASDRVEEALMASFNARKRYHDALALSCDVKTMTRGFKVTGKAGDPESLVVTLGERQRVIDPVGPGESGHIIDRVFDAAKALARTQEEGSDGTDVPGQGNDPEG